MPGISCKTVVIQNSSEWLCSMCPFPQLRLVGVRTSYMYFSNISWTPWVLDPITNPYLGPSWLHPVSGVGGLCKQYGCLITMLCTWNSYKIILNVKCDWKVKFKLKNKNKTEGCETVINLVLHPERTLGMICKAEEVSWLEPWDSPAAAWEELPPVCFFSPGHT